MSFPQSSIPRFGSLAIFEPKDVAAGIWQMLNPKCPPFVRHKWCQLTGSYAYDLYLASRAIRIETRIKAHLEAYKTESLEDIKTALESEELIALLPGVVPAFSLRSRKWVQLDLSKLEYITQEDDWKSLVLVLARPRPRSASRHIREGRFIQLPAATLATSLKMSRETWSSTSSWHTNGAVFFSWMKPMSSSPNETRQT